MGASRIVGLGVIVAATSGSSAQGRRLVLAAAVFWSLSGVVTKGLALDSGSIAFYRSLVAGLALLAFVPRARWQFRPGMIPLVVAFAAMIGLYIAAMKATTAANTIFLQCTSTVWVVPLGIAFLRERPDRRSLIGIALAMVGVAAILAYGHAGRPDEVRGVIFGLASGVAFASVMVAMRSLRSLDPLWLTSSANLGGAALLATWLVASGTGITIPTRAEAVILVGFGILQMAIPYALFARGLQTVGAAEAGLIGLVEPLLNPLWVYLLHGERPGFPTLIGGAFLLAGVAVRFAPVSRVPKRS